MRAFFRICGCLGLLAGLTTNTFGQQVPYYPKLSAVQVKDIILKSVVKREALTNYCSIGGIVNEYAAL